MRTQRHIYAASLLPRLSFPNVFAEVLLNIVPGNRFKDDFRLVKVESLLLKIQCKTTGLMHSAIHFLLLKNTEEEDRL